MLFIMTKHNMRIFEVLKKKLYKLQIRVPGEIKRS